MRILVTGGAGFIGSAVIRQLIRETDAEVVNLDKLTYAATPEALEETAASPRYRPVRGDICDRKLLARLFEEHAPDAIMHLAAESHVDRSIDGPAEFLQTNIFGTFALLEAARAWRSGRRGEFRFLHVSTDEVFGALGPGDRAFCETTRYAPNSPYSASKAASDHLVRAWGETYGLPVLTTNCSNNYGPWQFPEKLIPLMTIAALEGQPLPVYGTGENVRDWLHVEDHARALRLVLERGRTGACYTIGGDAERSNIAVVRRICAEMDARFPRRAPHARQIRYVRDRPGHDLRYAVDAGTIRRELGWRPERGFEDGLAQTIGWYLDHADWWRSIRAATYSGARLVLGRTGQLARALAEAGPADMNIAFAGREECDLEAPDAVTAAIARHAPDAVINAAAYTAVDRAETEPELAYRVNAMAVAAAARACTEAGAALVHPSTDYVFDGVRSGGYCETNPTGPLNVYGASKLAGEEAARSGCPRTVILRTSWVFSPWGRNFVTTMLRLGATRARIRVVADQLGKPTSALDLAEACLTALRIAMPAPADAPVWGLYHYAGSRACSWAEFAEGIFAAAHRRHGTPIPLVEPISSREYPTPALRPASSVLDCGKFEAAFGLRCVPWQDALVPVIDRIAPAMPEARGIPA